MSDPKRIDPAAVAAWFKSHRLVRPIQRRFKWLQPVFPDSPLCRLAGCCGLSSQLARHDLDRLSLSARVVTDVLGLETRYTQGFIEGWDGECDAGLSGGYGFGYVDGRTAWSATMEALR